MKAFRCLGWDVRPYIMGDRLSLEWVVGVDSEQALMRNPLKRLAADWVRVGMGVVHGWRASRELGQVDWAYERYGAFQGLGWWFQQKGIPWILETNELYYVNAVEDRKSVMLRSVLRIQERWAYQKCDILVCISQALADLVMRNTGIPASKIVVLPNGVDIKHLDPSHAHPVRFFDSPTIGFVGQLQAWQRLDLLIEAVARLRREGISYSLVVVGNGPMREPWEALVASLGLSEQVRFVGRVPWEEIPDYIAGFDLGYAGAIPLAAGSMYLSPLKLYEYTAMGKPVVAADYSDARNLIADGAAGYLFESGNREDLCRALRRAYEEREHWLEIGARSRSVVIAKHCWEVRVRELIRAVEAILTEKYGTPYPARRCG